MTDTQRKQIRNLRVAGLGYKKIAEQMEMSENTVKTYCRKEIFGEEKEKTVKQNMFRVV